MDQRGPHPRRVRGRRGRLKGAPSGVLCVAVFLAAQVVEVYGLRGGNWSALFFTSGVRSQPELAQRERTYSYAGSPGYDSQFYHWIAHDPLLERGLKRHVDTPQLRWRRILVPALAWLTALGQDRWIDPALIAQQYLWVYLGGFWLGPWFLLVPAVLASVDRLTVDLAFAALCCGLVHFESGKRRGMTLLILALAALTRETGLLLIAATAVFWGRFGRFFDSGRALLSAFPALFWYFWLLDQPGASDWRPVLSAGIWVAYPGLPPALTLLTRSLDLLSLAGAALAVVLAIGAVRRPAATLADHAAAAFALFFAAFALFVPWYEPYGYVRVCSPMYLFLAMRGGVHDSPLLMSLPRLVLQLGGPLWRAARLF